MIYIATYLRWPWFKEISSKDYFYKYWSVTKNKTLEVQVSRGGDDLIGGSFRIGIREDHAGLSFDISLFRRFISISFQDNRHWNHEKNRYVNYDDPEEVKQHG